MLTATKTHQTQFHKDAFQELMQVYSEHFLSPLYVGWAKGFLDGERERLEAAIMDGGWKDRITVDHPVRQIRALAADLRNPGNAIWYE